jgi:hypothetical protein
MPQPRTLQKAELQAITWEGDQVVELDKKVTVQFNPESLKVAFANQTSGGDQSGGAATQFVAQGTTKLAFDLWFDVTAPQPDGREEDDVRRLTQDVVYFMRPNEELEGAPPGVRFLWGTFLFEGVMDSVNETLEFFSEDGRPLRAGVTVNLSQQEIQFKFGEPLSPGLGTTPSPGSTPQETARAGDSVQDIAAREGRPEDWQDIALANGIENPRQVPAGTPLRTNL